MDFDSYSTTEKNVRAKRKTEGIEEERNQIKEIKQENETARVDWAHWKDKTAEIQSLAPKLKAREPRALTAIHNVGPDRG